MASPLASLQSMTAMEAGSVFDLYGLSCLRAS
jgi:hypothetical protein